ncbi:MAG: WecB/TagA/CpsF family glycosyltransferase [Deltaproteobacteria bacterium]|nr:WecB/TagA/CpsF family glycosyltransferase [Deltaproteobacteria bacterium]
MQNENLVGYPVSTLNLESCVSLIRGWIGDRATLKYFACANPHSLVLANQDRIFRKALLSSDLLTPDGAGIVLASRLQGGRIRQRITGSDIFKAVSQMINEMGTGRIFFLGSTDLILSRIIVRFKRDYPYIKEVRTFSPPFKPVFSETDNEAMVACINDFKPDILWVGMTAPKQEKWIYQNRYRLKVPFVGAIGAVFDFYAGNVKRSSTMFQKLGLEWLPRLIQEPKRLWRRNFISSPLFLLLLIRYRMKK